MSDHQDYAAIRRNIANQVARRKWQYRVLFFATHLIFYAISMLTIWLTAGYASSHGGLYETGAAATILLVPTILWTAVLLFHVASFYFETSAGEAAIRERLMMREVREEMLRKGMLADEATEKPKRYAAKLSDDGELIPADDDDTAEQATYTARPNHLGSS
ncbi:MAG: hypothetical protein KF726_07255 [Anaerolineae bacterium]|nr:hypothetical protein [Anaerolineae bacterium]